MQNESFYFILDFLAIVWIVTDKWLVGIIFLLKYNAWSLVSDPQLAAADPVGATVNVEQILDLTNLTNILWKYKANYFLFPEKPFNMAGSLHNYHGFNGTLLSCARKHKETSFSIYYK